MVGVSKYPVGAKWAGLALGLGVVFACAGFAYRKPLAEQWFWLAHIRGHELAQGRERALRPGESFMECGKSGEEHLRSPDHSKHCPEMIVIPAGTFKMGSADGRGDEQPAHEVKIVHPFAVSKFEVTAEQWNACVDYGGCMAAKGSATGKMPATGVSWNDARLYAAWLSGLTGGYYRLLSEAEWEYAARAGTSTSYSWGDSADVGLANCRGCAEVTGEEQSVPVGSFKANAHGLHDMHGNVWEWVEDVFHGDYRSAPADGSAWMALGDQKRRMFRGGAWNAEPENLRSAHRGSANIGDRYPDLGFRLARSLLR